MTLTVTLPTPGDPATDDVWGTLVNSAFTTIVAAINALPTGGGGATLVATSVKTTNYTSAVNDLAKFNCTAGNLINTLPTTPATGSEVGAELTATASGHFLTYTCGGANTFADGTTSKTLTTAGESVVLEWNGSTWDFLSGAGWLEPGNNLSDVANAAASLGNLGGGSLATLNPTGTSDGTGYLRDDGVFARVPALFVFSADPDGAEIGESGLWPPLAYGMSNWGCRLGVTGAPSGSSLTVVLRYTTNGGSTWTTIQSLTVSSGSTTPATATSSVSVPVAAQLNVNCTSNGSTTAATGAVFSAVGT